VFELTKTTRSEGKVVYDFNDGAGSSFIANSDDIQTWDFFAPDDPLVSILGSNIIYLGAERVVWEGGECCGCVEAGGGGGIDY
jgi:hypothetical protein